MTDSQTGQTDNGPIAQGEQFYKRSPKKGSANDKVMMLLAPSLDNKISRSHNLILKNALFQFISDTDKKL